jgi:hypothetical protein
VATVATHLNAASAIPPVPHDPTIVLEAESGLVGGAVSVSSTAAASGGAFVHFSGPAQPPPAIGIRVAGNLLLRDGMSFVPVGFTVVGLAHPMEEGGTAWAAGRLDDTLDEALAWGANTVRFQLSQRGLDPTDTLYSDAYVARIAEGVALARARNLVVMLSIQDQALSGGSSHGQPSSATIRDWQTVAARFNGEPNVLYEMFNEPQNRPTPDGWAVWRNGGPPDRNQGTPAVGHQAVLDAIRATGATNTVVADASQFAQRLDGIPPLHDPLGQVAYGVHPYLTHTLREPTDWEPGFGFLSTQYPVIATEWTAVPWVRFCHPEWESTSPQLLTFLQQRNIGMLAWALDVLNSLVADSTYTPTSLAGFQCGADLRFGAGELFKADIPTWSPRLSPCTTGLSDEGGVAFPVDVPEGGEYRLWSRVMKAKNSPDAGAVLVQVDDACPISPWPELSRDGQWSWQSTRDASFELTAGRHTVRILGGNGSVNLDRIVLTADEDCVPDYPTESCVD